MQSRRVINDHEKRVVAYHEAGHALCSASCCRRVERVHRISIVPRGRALGYTLNLPEEDRYLKTREELIDYMTVLLGGRVAEQLVFGADHHRRRRRPPARSHEISRSMVTEYAMGTELHVATACRRTTTRVRRHPAAARRGAARPRRPGPPRARSR